MPEKIEPLQFGHFYHIYNRGINGCQLFKETTNYEYFLRLYDKHISPIADTYAWVLMGNHFHMIIRIKEEDEVQCTVPSIDLSGFENLTGLNTPKPPHQYFSNLFNAYSKAFNKQEERHGNLFERPFRRKLIDSTDYLQRSIIYVHQNPVHHGFCDTNEEYPWSSFHTFQSEKPTKLKRKEVLELFGDRSNFNYVHQKEVEMDGLE